MADINLYEAYNSKLRKFGVNDQDRFRNSFVDAVNLTYAEFNSQVFQSETLEQIESYDDIIDSRLGSFSTLTFGSDALVATSDREFWSIEYDFEKTSATNGMTDTITDGVGTIVLSIADGVFSIATSADTIDATGDLPESDTYKIIFESSSAGNSLTVNGDEVELTYTNGDEDTTQSIGTVASRVISATSGLEIIRTRFLSAASIIYDFDFEEESTNTNLTDSINSYILTIVTPVWRTVYIEPSSSLDSQYKSPFNMALDFHLQDGGEWSIEPEQERERKWYGRGIKMARFTLQNNTEYSNPLGI